MVTASTPLPRPWQQFVDAIDRMPLADAVEDVGQPDLRVYVIELGGLEPRIHCRCPLAAAARAGEQPILAPDRDASQHVLGKVFVDLEPPVLGVSAAAGSASRFGSFQGYKPESSLCGENLIPPLRHVLDLCYACSISGDSPAFGARALGNLP